jgi:hypothetical protein
MNFFWDEWNFISYERPWRLDRLLLEHNEYWSTIPILVWKVLFVVVGIRSHIPYEAVLLVFHVAAVFLLFTLIRRRSGDLPAFAAALTLLVLGSGGRNIVWAFQIGFVGSVAFGLMAMVLLDSDPPFPGRVLPASAALLCSLMCSAAGLAFLVAVGVELCLDPRRRRFLLALAAPGTAFGEWFLRFGAGIQSPSFATQLTQLLHDGSFGLNTLRLAGFVAWGLAASVAGLVGWSGVGAVLLPVLATLVAWRWYRRGTLESWQVGMTAGVLSWFALVGLGRAQYGPTDAGESQYVYVGVVFLLPLIADVARDLPWRKLWRPALAAAFALGLVGNIVQLRDRALVEPITQVVPFRSATEVMRIENAELQTAEVFRGAPDMALNRAIDDGIMPQLNAGPYFAAIDELGSPVPAATMGTLRELPREAVDRVMVNLFGGAVTVSADSSRSTQGLPCKSLELSAGSTMDFQVPDAQSLMLKFSTGNDVLLFLGFLNPPTSEPLLHVQVQPNAPEWLYLPNTGKPTVWKLRVAPTAVGMVQVCGNATVQLNLNANRYSAEAASGQLDAAWTSVPDSSASGFFAAKASRGTFPSYQTDLFGVGIFPLPGVYDVWYRVRVASPAGTTLEMTLGIWDDQTPGWLVAQRFQASEFGASYSWVKVTTGLTVTKVRSMHFIASFTATLGTDWYIDKAEMVPPGSPV